MLPVKVFTMHRGSRKPYTQSGVSKLQLARIQGAYSPDKINLKDSGVYFFPAIPRENETIQLEDVCFTVKKTMINGFLTAAEGNDFAWVATIHVQENH